MIKSFDCDETAQLFAGKDFEDKRPRDRYVLESKRLLNVLNQRLEEIGRAHV